LISSPSSLATKWNAGWAEILSQGRNLTYPAHASQVSIFNQPDHMSTTHHDGIWFMAAWLYIEPTPRVDRRRTQSIAITSRGRPREQPTVWSRRTLLSLSELWPFSSALPVQRYTFTCKRYQFRKCVKLHAKSQNAMQNLLLGVTCRSRTTVCHLHYSGYIPGCSTTTPPTRGYHSIMLIHDSLDTEAFQYLLSTISWFYVPPDPCGPAAPCYTHHYRELIPLR
jgi:hypothetical protein